MPLPSCNSRSGHWAAPLIAAESCSCCEGPVGCLGCLRAQDISPTLPSTPAAHLSVGQPAKDSMSGVCSKEKGLQSEELRACPIEVDRQLGKQLLSLQPDVEPASRPATKCLPWRNALQAAKAVSKSYESAILSLSSLLSTAPNCLHRASVLPAKAKSVNTRKPGPLLWQCQCSQGKHLLPALQV